MPHMPLDPPLPPDTLYYIKIAQGERLQTKRGRMNQQRENQSSVEERRQNKKKQFY